MGACCAAENPDGDEPNEKPPLKILFLGSGGCGKSTFFRQLKKLLGQGFKESDYAAARGQIASFVVETMKKILEFEDEISDDDSQPFYTELEDEALQKAAADVIAIRTDTNSSVQWTPELIAAIKLLWAEQAVKDKFDETAKSGLNAACEHFFDSMDRISAADFTPTDTDILMQRRPTTGLIEQVVSVGAPAGAGAAVDDDSDEQKHNFQLVDVGGQKNERRKWIHQFENVSAIVYVVSLSAFDEPLYEDETVNSMRDSLQLFRETLEKHAQWFKQSQLFLLFNKKDLFAQKMAVKSMAECFGQEQGYDVQAMYEDVADAEERVQKNMDFVKQQFLNELDDESKVVRAFETCAYQESEVEAVFGEILQNIVSRNASP